MISFAKKEMIPDLKNIWKECFHDLDNYITFYFENRFKEENTLVFLQESIPVGMLTLLPAKIYQGGKDCSVFYVYAVATLPKWQGKKIASLLLKFAKEYAQKKEAYLVLVPAQKSLFSYYKKQGYKENFFVKEEQFFIKQEKMNNHIKVDSILPEEYKNIRDKFFQREGYVKWDLEAINYSIKEIAFLGGFCYKISLDKNTYAILGYVENEILMIKEAILPDTLLIEILSEIAYKKEVRLIKVRLPVFSTLGKEKKAFGMTIGFSFIKDGYLNLVLD